MVGKSLVESLVYPRTVRVRISKKLGVVSNAPSIAKGIIVETEQLLVDPKGTPYVRMIVSLTILSIPLTPSCT